MFKHHSYTTIAILALIHSMNQSGCDSSSRQEAVSAGVSFDNISFMTQDNPRRVVWAVESDRATTATDARLTSPITLGTVPAGGRLAPCGVSGSADLSTTRCEASLAANQVYRLELSTPFPPYWRGVLMFMPDANSLKILNAAYSIKPPDQDSRPTADFEVQLSGDPLHPTVSWLGTPAVDEGEGEEAEGTEAEGAIGEGEGEGHTTGEGEGVAGEGEGEGEGQPGLGACLGLVCNEPGTGCTFTDEGVGCGPVGPREEGSACSTGGQCQAGLACIGPAHASNCRKICGQDSDCGPGAGCTTRVTGADEQEIGRVCAPREQPQGCTLLLQDCPAGKGCYPIDPSMSQFQCLNAGQGAQDADCVYTNDCTAGFLCMTIGEAPSACVQVCRLVGELGPECPLDLTCQDVFPTQEIGGICIPGEG